MATAQQIKSLIKHHYEEPERFWTIALQIAANEAQKGNNNLACDIRKIIDTAREKPKTQASSIPQDLNGLIITERPETSKNVLVMDDDIKKRIDQIIHEYRQQAKLKSHGLSHRRKILLIGSAGTGKTMTASVLANELKIPLHTIQTDLLITKYFGETASKLRQVFDFMQENHGVYLFDEFDAIGSDRTIDNDVGEMRRVVNSFLQFIEQDNTDNIIVAATNNRQLLDKALFRRFDDILYYEKPTDKEIELLISNRLGSFKVSNFSWQTIIEKSHGLSHAEIVLACNDAIKSAILNDKKEVYETDLCDMIDHRQYDGK